MTRAKWYHRAITRLRRCPYCLQRFYMQCHFDHNTQQHYLQCNVCGAERKTHLRNDGETWFTYWSAGRDSKLLSALSTARATAALLTVAWILLIVTLVEVFLK